MDRPSDWRPSQTRAPAGRQVTERKEKTALRSSNKIHSVTISVIVKDEYPGYCFFSTLSNALRQ